MGRMINLQSIIEAFGDRHEAAFTDLAEAKGRPATRGAALRFARNLRKYCGITPRRAWRNGKRVMLYARCHFERYMKTGAPLKDVEDGYGKSYEQLRKQLRGLQAQLAYAEQQLATRTQSDALLRQVKTLLASACLPPAVKA